MKKKLIFIACVLFIFSALPGVTHASGLVAPPNDLGLVGYWPFDSVSGTMTPDMSGNKNNGTTVNSPTLVTGKIGQALSFNGSNSVSVNSFSINTLTISAWIKTTQVVGSSGSAQIINRDDTGGNGSRDWQFRIQGSPVVPAIILFNTTLSSIVGVSGTTTVNDGKWHLVTATWDGSTIKLYVDGVLSGAPASFTGPLASGSPLLFAQTSGVTGGSNFNGSIDDVRIYSRALSAAEVQRLYQSGVATHSTSPTSLVPNGLVGYWTFDGQNTNWTANTTADVSGHGNTGTLVSMSPSTSPVLGRFGQALSFNSNGQEVSLANSAALPINTNSSVAFWYKSQPASYSNVYNVYNGSYGWEIQDRPSGNIGIRVDTSAAGNQVPIQVGSVNDGKWHDVVVTYTASTEVFSIYVNGVLAGTTGSPAYSGTLPSSATSAWIGGFIQSPEYIDDVRIYNRALSPTEIKQLYNAGAVGTTVDTAPAQALSGGGLVGYWPFDGNEMNWASSLALDGSGNGYNGTLVNMTPANAVMGKIGQALSFNGNNQYINVSPYPSTANPLSVSAWVDPTSLSQGSYGGGVGGTIIDENENGGTAGWVLGVRNTNKVWFWPSGGNDKFSTGSVPLNQWTHVAVTYDGSTLRMYLNGALDSAQAMSAPQGGATFLKLGAESWITGYWKGVLDDVRIYNRTLSASEVQHLYNLGK